MNSSSPPFGDARDNLQGDLGGELRGDAQKLTEAASERVRDEADNRKAAATDQAKSLSSALDKVAGEMGDDVPNWLKSAFTQGAQSLNKLAETVDQQDTRQLIGNLKNYAAQNPATFLAGCTALGFAAARVFKAGESDGGDSANRPPGQSAGGFAGAGGTPHAPSNAAGPSGQDPAEAGPAIPLSAQDVDTAASRYQV